ncbi:hypothetical protein [Sphingomonas sp.]|uniref:hypothetical protein n=1 Tax=Sphingomonas sp. TaxID=28214 RepID=UPI001B0E0A5B|nr:hypothetical protein [Sphingomonas sp.]MBO9713121.1 hypothetical protein [Sphingomonas sp.]
MANVDGSWNTVTKSPMGDQAAVLTVSSSGGTFTGNYAGGMGTTEVKNGKVNGDQLTGQFDITVPMPMTLDFDVKIDGDNLSGTVTAGMFGSFPITGTRA